MKKLILFLSLISIVFIALNCKEKMNLSPKLSSDNMLAFYIDKPFNKKEKNKSYPICIENWFEGSKQDIQKSVKNVQEVLKMIGGKQIESCNDYKQKALFGCRDEYDITQAKNLIDRNMFKGVKKFYEITYFLGNDIKKAQEKCQNKEKSHKMEFIEF